jgi:hypothetical protein
VLSAVYRIDRSGSSIVRVVFRCPLCREPFEAETRNIYLR